MNTMKLKGLIRGRGMTQGDVAFGIGMALGTFNQKINGAVEFKLSEVKKIVSFLSMTPEEVNLIFLN